MFKTARSSEVMISFTFVVAWSLIGLGTMIIVVEARNPEADTGIIANTLMSLVFRDSRCAARADRREVGCVRSASWTKDRDERETEEGHGE